MVFVDEVGFDYSEQNEKRTITGDDYRSRRRQATH